METDQRKMKKKESMKMADLTVERRTKEVATVSVVSEQNLDLFCSLICLKGSYLFEHYHFVPLYFIYYSKKNTKIFQLQLRIRKEKPI